MCTDILSKQLYMETLLTQSFQLKKKQQLKALTTE